jgi:hypothetical protein
MAFLKLCNKDPLLSVLKDHFDASLARVPKASLKPLLVLGLKEGKLNTLGQVSDLFIEKPNSLPDIISESINKNLSGKRSGSMDIDFGLKILEGFFKGFNLPSAGMSAAFSKAKNISYSFDGIRSQYFESLKLGALLGGQELDVSNLSLKPFLSNKQNRLFVIVRTYQSKSFNIHFDKAFDVGLRADLSGLGELISMDDSSVSISKKDEGGILFSGSKYKTFAFQLVELELEDDGLYIKQILADNDHKVLRENGQLPRSFISDEFVMFDLDPINEPAI